MLLLRKPQLRATSVLERTLSTSAVRTTRPKPMSRETCRQAQMAHQEMKIRKNLFCERGDLAIRVILAFYAWCWRGCVRRDGWPEEHTLRGRRSRGCASTFRRRRGGR